MPIEEETNILDGDAQYIISHSEQYSNSSTVFPRIFTQAERELIELVKDAVEFRGEIIFTKIID